MKEETKVIKDITSKETRKLQKFFFPSVWKTIEAESLEDAKKLINS
jgi:hypothetical protein